VVVSEGRAGERGDANAAKADEESSSGARLAALAGLIALAVLAYLVLFKPEPYKVTAEFANAAQVVKGNEVVVGGTKVGSVDAVELGPSGAALITFTVSDDFAPLHRGTVATIRSPSLSQIAGRQIQLTLPADSQAGDEIPSGGKLDQSETVSAVDLDQLFNTLSPKTIKDFKHVIQGFELSYEGVGEQANKGLHYLNPFLSTSRRLFAELTYDEQAFRSLIVDTSKLSGALAERSSDISGLVGNLDRMMTAIGDRKERLALAVSELPDFMRRANTTFVNLRAALDDVTPLVEASKPAAEQLRPFLAELRQAAADAVPTVTDLDAIVKRPGAANDLVDLNHLQPQLTDVAVGSGSPDCGAEAEKDFASAADGDFTQGSLGESVCSLANSLPQLSQLRAYTPELVGWFDGFSSHSGYTDANGGLARVHTIFNTFTISEASNLPIVSNPPLPISDPARADIITSGATQKCPGGNERPLGAADPADDSVPFTDGGALTDNTVGSCNPDDVQPGP
jgi:phospholipid/cholesterol/gamma-HCH transport system substrate-binding protein